MIDKLSHLVKHSIKTMHMRRLFEQIIKLIQQSTTIYDSQLIIYLIKQFIWAMMHVRIDETFWVDHKPIHFRFKLPNHHVTWCSLSMIILLEQHVVIIMVRIHLRDELLLVISSRLPPICNPTFSFYG
jgi:hypothetical protein